MQIRFASVIVQDQDRALDFYTNVLGFCVREDLRMGPFRWLTVESPEGPAGVELVLEADDFPPSAAYRKARFDAGIPAIALVTGDLDAEYRRLASAGVAFRSAPTDMGFVTAAVFEDGCGNLVNLVQQR